jgi:hypothetical protein
MTKTDPVLPTSLGSDKRMTVRELRAALDGIGEGKQDDPVMLVFTLADAWSTVRAGWLDEITVNHGARSVDLSATEVAR